MPSAGKSTLPVLDSGTVCRPTRTCSQAAVSAIVLRHLPDHLVRALVPAQTLEPGVAQLPGGGPFAEPDLPDQLRFGPVHATAAGQLTPAEGRRVPLQLAQLVMQQAQHGRV